MTITKQGNPAFRFLRLALRSQMTTPEQVMWSHLRLKQFHSLKFRRQHGIGNFIVDFYCPKKRVVIEVDGDIMSNIESVLEDLWQKLSIELSTSPNPSPPQGQGCALQRRGS